MARYAVAFIAWLLACLPAAAEPSEATASFVQRAAQSDLFELESAELAIERGGETIQPLANLLLADHARTAERLTALAGELGVEAPTELETGQQEQLKRSQEISAAEFDRAWLEQQQAAHEEAVALYSGYAMEGDDPSARAFAAEVLPTLNAHLDKINALLAAQ